VDLPSLNPALYNSMANPGTLVQRDPSGQVDAQTINLAGGAIQTTTTGAIIARGAGAGALPALSPMSSYLLWNPGKGAFRAGRTSVVGSEWNDAETGYSSVGMGENVTAKGYFAVAIGSSLRALGDNSVALGTGATVANSGSFVYGDGSGAGTTTSADNQFLVRASGGTIFYSNSGLSAGVTLAPGGGSWSSVSDAAMKENFRDLDGALVLGKLAAMPIREWNYIAQADAIRHVGPTAQDFHAAFGLGEDPLKINTIDADGIALLAIQALARRNAELNTRVADLERRLAALETAQAAGRRP
jgi:hypothetical protein